MTSAPVAVGEVLAPPAVFSVPSAPVALSSAVASTLRLHSAWHPPCFAARSVAKTILNRFRLASRLEAEQSSAVHIRKSAPKQKAPDWVLFDLEVTIGFEPMDNGVADRGLTTWLRHQNIKGTRFIRAHFLERITGLEPATFALARRRSTK